MTGLSPSIGAVSCGGNLLKSDRCDNILINCHSDPMDIHIMNAYVASAGPDEGFTCQFYP